jgi:hypothetical protein
VECDRLVALADEAVGPRSIQVLDMRELGTPPGSRPYVTVNCWIDIEKYVSPESDAELHARYLSELEEQSNKHSKYLQQIAGGDIDAVVNVPGDEEIEAGDALSEVAPTTLQGLLALLIYIEKAQKVPEFFTPSITRTCSGDWQKRPRRSRVKASSNRSRFVRKVAERPRAMTNGC